jgi:hypothetical protein
MTSRLLTATTVATLAALALAGSACLGQAAAATATTSPAATAPSAGPEEMKLLRELEAAGDKHRTIRADVDFHVDMRALGDGEDRTGYVAYQKGDDKSPTRFRVTFDTLQQGAGRKTKAQVDYIFDGAWLGVLKHQIKNITLFQLAAKGQRIDPLVLGRGPFPLPFGQKAAVMVQNFIVTLLPAQPEDPKGTIGVRLVTRENCLKDMPIERIEMWVDRATYLPVKIRSRDKNKDVTTVVFKGIQTNKEVDAKLFEIPTMIGWEKFVRPLKQEGGPGAAP